MTSQSHIYKHLSSQVPGDITGLILVSGCNLRKFTLTLILADCKTQVENRRMVLVKSSDMFSFSSQWQKNEVYI